MYRIRITDPPAAIRMYDPPPLVESAGGDTPSVWGIGAHHHYDMMLWVPERGKGYYGGQSEIAIALHSFNPSAPTPKSAWEVVSPVDAALQFGYASFVMMTDNELYWTSNTTGQRAVVNLTTGVRRTLNAWPTDPFKSIGSSSAYCYMRRASTALTSKVYFTDWLQYSGANRRWHVRWYDPSTGGFSTMGPGNAFPEWWRYLLDNVEMGNAYRTIALATGAFGERVVGYPNAGQTAAQRYSVFCYNPDTDTMLDYTSAADPKPSEFRSGMESLAQRWQYVPEVKAFVALRGRNEDVWVFRPPAAWGIV
jgi:hypothetical protein